LPDHEDEDLAPMMGATPGARSRLNLWIAGIALLVVVGTVGSVMGAQAVARNDAAKSHQAFEGSAAQIASSLKQALVHEQDLSVSAAGVFVRDPESTQTEFLQWTSSIHAFARYPELQGLSELTLVPASQLNAFAARQVADPSGPLTPNGTFDVSPPGTRAYYCLASVSQSRYARLVIPAGLDYCTTSLGKALLTSRDSGKSAAIPYKTGKTEELGMGTPIYQGGVVPKTVQARQAAFIGWTGTEILPKVVLTAAIAGHPSTAVAYRYRSGSSDVTYTAGTTPSDHQSTTIALSDGWHVQVFGSATSAGVFANRNALTLLLGGVALSWILGLLLYVLATSRSRALALVHERTDELRFQAFHDSLTGLPNRALILDRIDHMLARARRDHTTVAALFLDLDNFKDINDTLGHRSGDELLAGVSDRLAGVLREGDTVGRLGGDEFVMLVEGTSRPDAAEMVAQRILDALEAPFEVSGSEVPLTVTASIGIATGDRASAEELLRDADIALYQAKGEGKRRAAVFVPSMLETIDVNRSLDVDLHAALEANQFFLLYQPTIDLATGAFTGVEALLRWRHPTRGVVMPNDFIPALEASGLIVPVGQWVLETACRQGAKWQSDGYSFVVSVNVAAKQLQRDRIVDDVYSALSSSRFDAHMLVLELTESALVQNVETTVARLQLLKSLGVRLAIDDFGTGFSSLAYLQQFPIDILKIDRSFISGITDSAKSAAIIDTFVQLGRALNLEVIAEGIENDDQRAQLATANVNTGQGFLFAHPLDVEAVDRMLNGSTEFGRHAVGSAGGWAGKRSTTERNSVRYRGPTSG
jgi:diguanylate cyclase (GGDEF)-like protein